MRKHITIKFHIPHTQTVKVLYKRDGDSSTYSRIIPRPVSDSALEVAMLQRGIAKRQIQKVEPVISWAA